MRNASRAIAVTEAPCAHRSIVVHRSGHRLAVSLDFHDFFPPVVRTVSIDRSVIAKPRILMGIGGVRPIPSSARRSYASNGVGIGIFTSLSSVAEMISNLLTVCLFLLLAMGWMISMQKMPEVSVLVDSPFRAH